MMRRIDEAGRIPARASARSASGRPSSGLAGGSGSRAGRGAPAPASRPMGPNEAPTSHSGAGEAIDILSVEDDAESVIRGDDTSQETKVPSPTRAGSSK